MAEIRCASPGELLLAGSLGSCVAVVMHDAHSRSGAMAHVMLPDSTTSTVARVPGKFADLAVPAMVKLLAERGTPVRRLRSFLAGGASMFSMPDADPILQIGQRNIEACRLALQLAGVPLAGEDVGGGHGRTVSFDPDEGVLTIQSLRLAVKRLR